MTNSTSTKESEIAGVEMPEPVAWRYSHFSEFVDDVYSPTRKDWQTGPGLWTEAPLYTADQLRQAVEAERALWQQDALRYRWLRANSTQPVEPWSTHSCPESLDDVVDAEMKNRPGPTR
jgi:hypothetical protein